MIKQLLSSRPQSERIGSVLRTLLKGMRARYVMALLSVAVLSSVSYIGFNNMIKTEARSAAAINISGRQRMLSQRIPMLGQLIVTEPAMDERGLLIGQLRDALGLMETSHMALREGNSAMGLATLESEAVRHLMSAEATGLDAQLRAFFHQSHTFVTLAETGAGGDALRLSADALAQIGGELLPLLDKVVTQFEMESQAAVMRLQKWQTGVFAVLLIVLVIEGLVIFWPLEKELNRNFRQLLLSRDLAREAQDKADRANQAKSEFLANMSHELRTPLNAINGFSELMASEIFGPMGNNNYREYAQDILKSGRHLLRVIDDILDVSAVESGAVRLSEDPVSLRPIFEEARSMFSAIAGQDGIEIVVGDFAVPDILADYNRVRQIVMNLVSNAVKFSNPGNCVEVSADCDGVGGVLIRVSDQGIGIDPEDIEYVLEPFAQVKKAYTRGHDGSGLGLTLCNSLMKLHGGTLTIHSRATKGTEVHAHFPAERNLQ